MAISTLSSPGVEVRELDNSLRISYTSGTTIYIPGFAAQGPTEEVNQIGTMDDFEILYGTPTNMAECYFYYTVAAVIENSGPGTSVLVYRLPYGEKEGDTVAEDYTMLAYPAVPISYPKHPTPGEDRWYPIGSSYHEGKINNAKYKIFAFSTSGDNISDTVEKYKYLDFNNDNYICLSDKQPEDSNQETPTPENSNPETQTSDDSDLITLASDGSEENNSNEDTSIYLYYTDKNHLKAIGHNNNDYYIIELSESVNSGNDVIEKYDTCIRDAGSTDIDTTYFIGAPTTFQLSLENYYKLLTGELIKWSSVGNTTGISTLADVKHAAFVTVNISRNIIDESYQGYYIGITDNYFNVADDIINSKFNAIDKVCFTNYFDKNSSATTTNELSDIKGVSDYQIINRNRLGFYLDQDYTGSVSRAMQVEMTKFDTSGELYDDTLNIGIFRLTKSTSNTNVLSLNYSISESYNAAFGKNRIQSIGTSTATKSYFIENETSNSMLMSILVNPEISESIHIDTDNILHGKIRIYGNKLINGIDEAYKAYIDKYSDKPIETDANKIYTAIKSYANIINRIGATKNDINGIEGDGIEDDGVIKKNNALYGFGKYSSVKNSTKHIGDVPAKVKRALKHVSNDEIYPDLDIVLEAGLGTIYAYAQLNQPADEFVDDVPYDDIEDLRTGRNTITDAAERVKENYMAVQQQFMAFADSFQNGGRGDTFYIADVLRGILIKGKNIKVSQLFGSKLNNTIYGNDSDNVMHSWNTSIYHPINHLLDTFTTSYASVYAQWFKINDTYSNGKIWVPSCGYVAALMARADANYGPWYAAAGYNRGIIPGVLDCAINPDQPQRDDLYKICVNSIPKIGNIGITIWGIRTMSKKASCFDQNTCRRTFLHMEKTIKRYLRYYVFEPNNSYTQIAIYNDLDPYLEGIKNRGGIYSYTLICDDTVNTDEIVNDGEMVVRCEAAPTRTAEKIVLEMVANRKNSTVTAV